MHKPRLLRLVKPGESNPIVVIGTIDAVGLLVAVHGEHHRDAPQAGVSMLRAVTEAMHLAHDAECWRRWRGLPHWLGEP